MKQELIRARQLAQELEPGVTLLDCELSREVAQLLLTLAYLVEVQHQRLTAAGLTCDEGQSDCPFPDLPEKEIPEDIRRPNRTPLLPPE